MFVPVDASATPRRILRGACAWSRADPFIAGVEASRGYDADAAIVIEGMRIADAGPAAAVLERQRGAASVERVPPHQLIVPGFVDCHVHYAQLAVMASFGTQLIDWLERYTFPAEQALADGELARETARRFFDATLAAGTTTAATYCTVHPGSVDAFFAEATARGVRAIAGKVLMDRHAPSPLTDTAQRGYDESKALIARWHGRDRLGYAITPRFAPTSSPAQLESAGALWREHPGCWMQSHVAENRREIRWVAGLFPEARDYVDVYAGYGLIGRRAVLGHGIHLSERERAVLAQSGTALAHCPTSNLFLGSGLFDWRKAKKAARPLRVGLGSDVGGGTSVSMLATAAEAYKVAQLAGVSLSPWHLLDLVTRAGADALDLADRIGGIAPGMDADLVVLDLHATPILEQRVRAAGSIDDALFALFMLGDDRAVRATIAGGRDTARPNGAG
jgi:guanine deaminase